MNSDSVSKLNADFLTLMAELPDQPQGFLKKREITKGKRVNGIYMQPKYVIGIPGSTEWATMDQMNLFLHPQLIPNFECAGCKYQIAPAVLAGIGSRESDLGGGIDTHRGWGDQQCRKNETIASYHGFGVLQVDRVEGNLTPTERKMLNDDYWRNGEPKLDPYGLEWILVGARILKEMIDKVKKNATFSDYSPAIQFATAVSYYNAGSSRGEPFPQSDRYTVKPFHDYANDVLVRAKYYAENWNILKNRSQQHNQFPHKKGVVA